MISTLYKTELVNKSQSMIRKARVNGSTEIPNLTFTPSPDSLGVEFMLPSAMIVNKVEFLDNVGNVITTITGLNIDTSVSTVFNHNFHFVQGGA